MIPTNSHINNDGYNNWVPPALKINKASHPIKKPSSSSSSSSSKPHHHHHHQQQQQRHPVIIYTHSPKVIHTEPKDFMALVQKLTGLDCDKKSISVVGDDADSSSVVTEDHAEPCARNNNHNNNNNNYHLMHQGFTHFPHS